MSEGAILSLVRESNLEASETLQTDYIAGVDQMNKHDEINLVTPNGEACAIPIGNIPLDLDYKYNYSDGSRGRQLRTIRRRMVFSIDYINEDTRNRLEMWMNERARFMLSPGYGRHTEAAWRPLVMTGINYRDGTPAYDLTGANAMSVEGTGTNQYLWDLKKQIMRGGYASRELPLFATPAGAAAGFPTGSTNHFKPWTPASATAGPGAGNSGWDTGGTDAADISTFWRSTGFGHTDAPGSLRVRTTNLVSTSRYMIQKNAFNNAHGSYQGWEPTGNMSVNLCTYLKGRFPPGAVLRLLHSGGGTAVDISLDDYDLAEWTPVMGLIHSDAWPTGANGFYIVIDLKSSPDGAASDFEIGPTFVAGSTTYGYDSGPVASDDTLGTGTRKMLVNSVNVPRQGSVMMSFYLPVGAGMDFGYNLIGLFTSISLKMEMFRTSGDWRIRASQVATTWDAFFTTLAEGEVHTIAFTWSGNRKVIFLNGVAIGDFTTTPDQDMDILATGDNIELGYRSPTNSWPLQMLTWRLDSKVFTDNEIGQLHSQLADPGSLGVIVPARGRVFEIKSIPSSPRPAPGGTDWLGTLEIEQVEYHHNLADLMTQEVSNV